MLHFDKFTHTNEDATRNAARTLARYFLTHGVNVIIDDTNLNSKTKDGWVNLAKELDAKIEYVDLDTEPGICIIRDHMRDKKVGQDVIIKMALQHKALWKDSKVVICDLDGTLCDITHRLQYGSGPEKHWPTFFSLIHSDTLRQEVLDQINSLSFHHLILVSARPEMYRKETEEWLERNGIQYGALIMREAHDKRDDAIVKKDIYEKYLKHLNIIKVFDDRPKVIRMWRELGLDVDDVGNGIEF